MEPTGRTSSESEAHLSDVVSDMDLEELSALDLATARHAEASRGGGAAGLALVQANEASGGGRAPEVGPRQRLVYVVRQHQS